jgi:predicted MFS family arabinose efflux permease
MGFLGATSAVLPLFSNALPMLLASAIGFGLATMPVFTAVTMLVRRHLPIGAWNGAIASATVIFAIGQSLGPIGSGKLSDALGLSSSLVWTAVIMTAGSLVALLQKPKNIPFVGEKL